MLETAEAYRRAGLDFAKHTVAVTQSGSALHRQADSEGWLRTFPMWDWVGGRTSVLSAVGLLPAALQGIDIDALLAGARDCDEATRSEDLLGNPAALLAAMWHYAGNGRGERNLVVLPYKDRLALFGKYLQQLLMESLGKQLDRAGRQVHQGLTVYGNKGSSDQHSFAQQLREGPNDFFVTFINVFRDRGERSMPVDADVTTGDYLHAFWHGTREALYENGRESITLTLDRLDARAIGALIALFERAVGLYAELIDINAYHQPGVEAGKKAADSLLDLQRRVLAYLRAHPDHRATAEQIADAMQEADAVEAVYHTLAHAAANPDHKITHVAGMTTTETKFGIAGRD
jgi:glucose-6-phosphate isomerase